ncbi:MAG TPA: dihydroneopterin aldolase [Verrucomicrobiota bacterium]|jgi:FolB domain-containing protein|nr:dihydroneopterin aldolase [Verrucomicrobiota bacterium]HCL92311.1 dihydroneopterin aldolase [Limisphaerales bacterium]HRR63555.1 dihydroneopterin aldolase [Candidatus Paceibacterota bacterium]NLH85290.1 dihydroneopterin aldolase [Verrucomicrobiota bacterium]HNR71977.1 dihydroneopterin aldolase [Verrucomicrobiota bacterium]
MAKITIVDLEVYYCVGVTDEERAQPQRLLLTVDMNFDFSSAAVSDRIERTINYQTVAEDLLRFGQGRSWKLVEKLADNIAERVLAEYKPQGVLVEVKKFSIPQARFVSVSLGKTRPAR